MLDRVPPPRCATAAVRDVQLASTHDWRYVHNVDLTLYAKADVVDFFIDAPLANPADAESAPARAASALPALGPPLPHLLRDVKRCLRGLAVAAGRTLDSQGLVSARTALTEWTRRLQACGIGTTACSAASCGRRCSSPSRASSTSSRTSCATTTCEPTGGRAGGGSSPRRSARVQRAMRDAAWDGRMCASARRGRRAPAMAGRRRGQCSDCVVHAMPSCMSFGAHHSRAHAPADARVRKRTANKHAARACATDIGLSRPTRRRTLTRSIRSSRPRTSSHRALATTASSPPFRQLHQDWAGPAAAHLHRNWQDRLGRPSPLAEADLEGCGAHGVGTVCAATSR